MAKLKVYTLGVNGFPPRVVLDMLGAPTHIRQASILIVASGKTAARVELETRKMRSPSLSDPEFRQADRLWPGFAEAGLMGQPGVFARLFDGSLLARVDADGQPAVVGRLDRSGAPAFVAEPLAVSESTAKE